MMLRPVFPRHYTVADILPSEGRMGRDGYQRCELHKTRGRRPRWFCKYAVDVLIDKKKVKRIERREYFGFCSDLGKREAERARDAFKETVNGQRDKKVRESQIPLSNWISTYEVTRIPMLKPNTQISYRSYCGLIDRKFGATRLCELKRDDIQQWLNELAPTRTRRTLEYILAVFTSLMDEALDSEYLETRNPCEKVAIPYGKRSTVNLRTLTPEEMRRLISVTDDRKIHGIRLGDIVRLGLFCGLRIGEILALEWGDVRGRELYVTKSRSQRTGEITEPKSDAGRRVVPLGLVLLNRPPTAADGDRVFPVDYWNVRKPMSRAFATAGIKLQGTTFHALRRTYATMRRNAGSGSLREAMGHSQESMSLHYVRESFADDEAAALRMAAAIMGDAGGRKM